MLVFLDWFFYHGGLHRRDELLLYSQLAFVIGFLCHNNKLIRLNAMIIPLESTLKGYLPPTHGIPTTKKQCLKMMLLITCIHRVDLVGLLLTGLSTVLHEVAELWNPSSLVIRRIFDVTSRLNLSY